MRENKRKIVEHDRRLMIPGAARELAIVLGEI